MISNWNLLSLGFFVWSFQRLGQDIAQQEILLDEIRHEEEDYEAEGRKEAANRLHEQLSFIEVCIYSLSLFSFLFVKLIYRLLVESYNLIESSYWLLKKTKTISIVLLLLLFQVTLQDVRNKFRKFQNPSELEPRLERMLRVLRDLEQSMCFIELASDDCEAIEGQLNNCIVSYLFH